MSWIDSALGIHPSALTLRSQRSEILAANIANTNTPQFKARDINFSEVLRNQENKLQMNLSTTNERHVKPTTDSTSANLLYRSPTKEISNGNTVEAEVEQAAFSENAIAYQTSIQFLNGTISGLRLAIKGQ